MEIGNVTGLWGTGKTIGSATNTVKTGDEVTFSQDVLSCTGVGSKKAVVCSDALMSYASPQTGESVNIYKADDYSKENPMYMIKGLDADGIAYEQEVDASKIDVSHCSYNELMVLNIETGHTSPEDTLHAIAARDKSGQDSYFDKTNYLSYIKEAMEDMKTVGAWEDYLSYGKWIDDLLDYQKQQKES